MENCRITVDGVEQKLPPATVALMPGEHLAVASDGDREYARVRRYLRAGETSHILLMAPDGPQKDVPKEKTAAFETVETLPASKEVADTEHKAAVERNKLLPAFWIASGVALGAGIATTVFGAKTLDDRDEWQNNPAPDDSLKEQGEQHRLLTNIMLGTTLAAATVATVIGVIHLRKKKQRRKTAAIFGAIGVTPGTPLKGHF